MTDDARCYYGYLHTAGACPQCERDEIRAENDRLRTVLHEVATAPYPDSDPWSLLETLKCRAIGALKGGETP